MIGGKRAKGRMEKREEKETEVEKIGGEKRGKKIDIYHIEKAKEVFVAGKISKI